MNVQNTNQAQKLRGPSKVGGGMKELPFAINGNAKAQTDTHARTYTYTLKCTVKEFCKIQWGMGKQHFAHIGKVFGKRYAILVAFSPINFHLQHGKFA